MPRYLTRGASFDRHDVDLSCSRAIADKSNLTAIARIDRARVCGRMACELAHRTTVDRDAPQVAIPGEGDVLAIGRDRWWTDELDQWSRRLQPRTASGQDADGGDQ